MLLIAMLAIPLLVQSAPFNNQSLSGLQSTSFSPTVNLSILSSKVFSSVVSNHMILTNKVSYKSHLVTTPYLYSSFNSTLGQLSNSSRNSTRQNVTEPIKDQKSNFSFILFIGGVSSTAFPVNFLIIVYLCCKKKFRVIELFGLNLAAFNLLLASFGIAIATYLSQDYQNWKNQFCQGLVSVKLFALGVNVWTLILLSYYYAVTGNGVNIERDALFKGIVYILEGLMLSGVFAIMAWIKLDKWNFLCIIIQPNNTVEWLLTGIESFYYILLIVLIIRYPYHLYKKIKNPKDYPNAKDAPIFVIVLISCVIWVTGFLITLPRFKLFDFESAAVARTSILILPTIIQPLLYLIRNTWVCTGRKPCSDKHKQYNNDTSVQLVCECNGRETCAVCDPEYEPDITYDEKTLLNREMKENEQIEKTKEIIKKNKKRKNKFSFPKAICRSPNTKRTETVVSITMEDSDNENVQFLKENLHLSLKKTIPLAEFENSPNRESSVVIATEKNDVEQEDNVKQIKNNNEFDQVKTTDEEGRVSRGPTFYPLTEKKMKRQKKSADVKKTPIKEEQSLPSTPVKTDIKDENETVTKPNDEEKQKKKKKEKTKTLRKLFKKKETDKHSSEQRESIVSLEWDHYSDDSQSSLSNSGYANRENLASDNNITMLESEECCFKNEQKITLRDLKSAQSCDWEPYSVDEISSSRTSSANKSSEFLPTPAINPNDNKKPNGENKCKTIEKNENFTIKEEN